jgi:hypothetical protein
MSYVSPVHFESLPPGGSLTNTQRALLPSGPAFQAYAQWYPLWEEVVALLGRRAAVIYALEISRTSNCHLCTASFRRALAGLGHDPDNYEVAPEEEPLVALGRAAGRYADPVHPHVWEQLTTRFSEKDLVNLTAFAGQTVALNLFNNLMRVPVDEALRAYDPAGSLVQLDFAWETL